MTVTGTTVMVGPQKSDCQRGRLGGIIAGLILNTNLICGAVSNFVSIDNLFVYLMLVLSGLTIVANHFAVPVKKKHVILLAVILLQAVYGILFVGTYMSQRFVFCAIGVAIPCLIVALFTIEINTLFSTVVISSAVFFPYYVYLYRYTYTVYDAGYQMGIAYSLLPGILTSLIVLFGNVHKKSIRVVSLIVLILAILVLFRLQTRGAYLCLFVFVVGLFYIKNRNNHTIRFTVLMICVLLSGVMMFFLADRLMSSTWYLKVFGKKSNNVLNGREVDYQYAFSWRGLKFFLFGSGVGSFQKYGYSNYIHNLFGMLLYEQGIYSALFVLVIIISALKILIKKNYEHIEVPLVLLVLFCTSIIRLMVSYYYWIDQGFWLFLWLVLGNNYKSALVVED